MNKIGFSVGSLLKPKQILNFCASIEENPNVGSIWVPESWGKEAFSTLGAISQITKKVNIGTSITNIYSRSPATIAMGAITLDNFSNGRMILGLGASTPQIIENLHGLKYIDPLLRMREYIESIKVLIESEAKTYSGKIVKINNFRLLEKPLGKIPIYIAAVNKKMINVAIDLAEGIMFYLKPMNELKQEIEKINLERSLKKEKFTKSLSMITSVSNKSPDKAKERAIKTLVFYIAVGKVYYKYLLKTEFRKEVEMIYNAYYNHGILNAMENVSNPMVENFTICGSVSDCKYQINKIIKTGIDLPILQINPIKNASNEFEYKDFLEL